MKLAHGRERHAPAGAPWRLVAALPGAVGIGYGLWVLVLVRTMDQGRRDAIATRIAVGTLVLLAASSAL